MAEGKAETLSGIEVLDDYTVKITLSAPNATFLHVMAINFASVVPREEAEKWGADFGKHPVGTGAFTLADWQLGQKLVFKKNPDYYKAGIPRLDGITFEVGQEPMVACCAWRRARSTSPATACRRPSSCSSARTRSTRTCWWSATSCTPAT